MKKFRRKMKNFKGSDLEMVLTVWALFLPIVVLFFIVLFGVANKWVMKN